MAEGILNLQEFEERIKMVKGQETVPESTITSFADYIKKNYSGFKEKKEDTSAFSYCLFEITEADEKELENRLSQSQKDETFSDMLIRLIRKSGKKYPQVYKKAGIDFRHFSKIITFKKYQPSKETVLALAISLELSIEETQELLKKAGYAFNPSSLFDVAVQYFIETKNYDRSSIDILMLKFSLPLLPQKW